MKLFAYSRNICYNFITIRINLQKYMKTTYEELEECFKSLAATRLRQINVK